MAARARKIVVAYDGSALAERALDAAADLVGYGSTLAVMPVPANGTEDMRATVDRAREHLLRRQVSALFTEPLAAHAEEIATAMELLEADLVVVGSRGGVKDDAELGPVAAGVLRQARCDVLVVR